MQPSRPTFAPGYGITSDAAGLIPWPEVESELAAARNYWIATVTPDGRPHTTPIWGLWREGRLYFGVEARSQKARNLEVSSTAVVHLESGDDVVIMNCQVNTVSDQDLARAVLVAYASKYGLPKNFSFDPVLVAAPDRGFAWRESDYPATATEYRS